MQTEQHFLIEQVLQQSEKATLNPETAKKLQVIKKEHNDKPVIFVGAGTCGLGAGAAETIKAAKKYKAALVGQPARDTIKEITKNRFITKTINRKKIFLAQTPQVIEYNLAKKAFEKAQQEKFEGTDDVSLVERLGKKVKAISCSYKNIKVTTKEDLKIIETLLKNSRRN